MEGIEEMGGEGEAEARGGGGRLGALPPARSACPASVILPLPETSAVKSSAFSSSLILSSSPEIRLLPHELHLHGKRRKDGLSAERERAADWS